MEVTNYYSIAELALLLKKSRQQISLDCRLGKLKHKKFGKSYFIHFRTVQKLLNDIKIKEV